MNSRLFDALPVFRLHEDLLLNATHEGFGEDPSMGKNEWEFTDFHVHELVK